MDQRPRKHHPTSADDDPIKRLLRKANRMQERRSYLRDGMKSSCCDLPHPTGVDPRQAACEIARLDAEARRMLGASEESADP